MVLTLLIVLFGVSSAQNSWTWIGGTMDFEKSYNWEGGVAPTVSPSESTIPCTTYFGIPNVNINSQLAAETYYVGTLLVLPLNGVLSLATNGTVLSFVGASSCNSTASYNWTGGLVPEQRNDFYCHKNWQYTPPSAKPTPPETIPNVGKLVPCIGDSIIFPDENTYEIFVPTNVSLITFASVTVGAYAPITSSSQSSLLQLEAEGINLLSSPSTIVYIGASSTAATYCKNAFQADLSSTAEYSCLCFSSCLDPQFALEAEAMTLLQQANYSEEQVEDASQLTTVSYTGSFTGPSLSLTTAQMANIIGNVTDNANLITLLKSAIATNLPAQTVTFSATALKMSNDGQSVVIAGSVYAHKGSLYAPGKNTIPSPFTWAATTPANASATMLQSIIQATLSSQMLNYVYQMQIAQGNTSAANATLNLINSATASEYVGYATGIAFGQSLTELEQLLAISGTNLAALEAFLTSGLTNFQKLQAVWDLEVTWSSTGSRRRSSTPGFLVSFYYNVSCIPGVQSCQQIQAPFSNQLIAQLNLLMSAFCNSPFVLPQCYLYSNPASIPQSLAYPYLYIVPNTTCLGTAATSYCNTLLQNPKLSFPTVQSLTVSYLQNLTLCNGYPTFPSGACFVPNVAPPSFNATTFNGYTCVLPTAASSSSGGGSLGMAAGAAGGGAAILALIIVLVVMRRRKRTSPRKPEIERTVVAFENPMYDDPNLQGHQLTYENALHHESEGLYDEPAFAGGESKMNPVYQSSEDLTAPVNYLETQPAGAHDGYLDVTPHTKTVQVPKQVQQPEDVGYLGQAYLAGPEFGVEPEYQLSSEPEYQDTEYTAPE